MKAKLQEGGGTAESGAEIKTSPDEKSGQMAKCAVLKQGKQNGGVKRQKRLVRRAKYEVQAQLFSRGKQDEEEVKRKERRKHLVGESQARKQV